MKTHGLSKTPEYATWGMMKQRCNNPKNIYYKYYGGRGIAVCKRWLKFENFYKDMGKRPDGLTLERVNNDEGYSLGNCKWATRTEQIRNRRINKHSISGVAGVTWNYYTKKWLVMVSKRGKSKRLGSFINLQEAIKVRKDWEKINWL